MKFAPWAAILAVVIFASSLPAQYWGPPRNGMGYSYSGRRVVVTGVMIGIPGYGYVPYPSFGMVRSSVVVVSPPRLYFPAMPTPDDPPPAKDKEEKEKPIPFDPDGVLVIRPRPGGVNALPPPRQMPEPPPKVAPPVFDPVPRQAIPPEKDAVAESARQVKLGRDAFAAGEYGRAAERFRHAIRVAPDQSMNQILLAQTLFAMGKYRESVSAIYEGMKSMPDWPKQHFPPRELYSDAGRDFPAHLDRLRQSLDRDPANPALSFLYGYQLWFDGRKADAKPYFQKAAGTVADPKPIERFLNE